MKLQSLRARTCAGFTLLIACLLLALSCALTERARRVEDAHATAALEGARARVVREWRQHERETQQREAQHLKNTQLSNTRALHKGDALGPRLLRRARESVEAREAAEDAQSLALLLIDGHNRVLYRSPGHAPPWPLDERRDWKVVRVWQGSMLALLALPRFHARLALRRQWESLLTLSAFVLACAAIGSWIVVGRSLSPIGSLARQARDAARRGAPGLQTRLSAPSSDREIEELVETFNALLQSLAEDAQARGRFYAAASHELRTPLQALSGHLDLALSRSREAPAYRAALEEAQAQSRRLAGLVGELLRLNQLEMANAPAPAEPLDLPDLLESVLRAMRPELQARGVRLETIWPDEAALFAPRAHVEMLGRNLLENAAKYTASGGVVRACVMDSGSASNGAAPAGLRLEVWNECVPQPDWQVEKWCEPFFRPDASRRSQTGGSGLGLALVKALCDTNGWQLSLRAEPNGGRAGVEFSKAENRGAEPSRESPERS